MFPRIAIVALVVSLTISALGIFSYSYPLGFTLVSKPREGRYLGLRVDEGDLIWIDCGLTSRRFRFVYDFIGGPAFFGRVSSYLLPNWDRVDVVNRCGEPFRIVQIPAKPGALHTNGLLPSDREWRRTLHRVNCFFASSVLALFVLFCTGLRHVLRLRNRAASRQGLCVRCGYDLTGNTSSRCPECGTAVGEVESAKPASQSEPRP